MSRQMPIPPLRDDGLQIDEDRGFQERFWRLQRIAWLVFGAICILAILGLTGSGGPLRGTSLRLDGAQVDLPRISRWEAADEISITFTAPAGPPTLRIGPEFFDKFSVERIQPEPQATSLTAAGQVLTFPAQGPGPYRVTMDIRAFHFGLADFDIAAGADSRRARILILP